MKNNTVYESHKKVLREPMSRVEYNNYRGWKLPDNEDGSDEGYLVEYLDGGKPNDHRHTGYISWSPKEQFDEGYTEVVEGSTLSKSGKCMSFGQAVHYVKEGKKITRTGWNGSGMFVVYQKGYPDGIPCNKQTAEAFGMKEGELFKVRPYLQLRTADGSHAMWAPSGSDSLADDWEIVI